MFSARFTGLCNHHHNLAFFHHNLIFGPFCLSQNKKPMPIRSHSSFPSARFTPTARKPLTYYQSLETCQGWTFYINEIMSYMAFSAWLLSFSVFSSFIHVAACISTWFLFAAEEYSILWWHILFLHSPVNGLLDYFYFVAVINNDVLNIRVCVCV